MSKSKVPVWLLDVHGVLNADVPAWTGSPSVSYAFTDFEKYAMTWSPLLTESICNLSQQGLVEVRWATTWIPWIEQIERIMNLGPFPVAFNLNPYNVRYAPVAKLDAALRVVEQENRLLIWTDDNVIPDRLKEPEAFLRLEGSLLIVPDSETGLSPVHMEQIESYCK